MANIPQLRALLISFFCEAVLYGVAFVLFVNSVSTLLRKRNAKGKVNRPLLFASSLLFLFSTMHIIGVTIRNVTAFTSYPDGPAAYFALLTNTVKTITQVGQVGAVITGDGLSVYRTFLVYNCNYYVVIFPLSTFIATIVAAAGFITVQHRETVATSIFQTTVTEWTQAFLATSLVTTGICTGLIVYRLWSVEHNLRKSVSHVQTYRPTNRILRILIESAALYSSTNLMYIILYTMKLNAEAIVSGFEVPVASITFSLITLRVEAALISSVQPSTQRSGVVSSMMVPPMPGTDYHLRNLKMASEDASHLDEDSDDRQSMRTDPWMRMKPSTESSDMLP
ncbi:hypothetical protein SISSUDRAFT_1062134 [Sistotremastrum suecicum HHB10207 ss-3]|uniref:Uncharacterized protein n=1 Tax=Sistotremastrum suecicum HHB10207 ss-3 TaxID=1314776 RepID=A0A166DA70_9AGAM|nr:hypothetical protein SISSUDRAFT_1062134 [Sistotremastrum suecicum HHB10207 ss-3]